jgi:N4-acetylcytidine amidohydrolase
VKGAKRRTLFKSHLAEKVRAGRKTQSRRISKVRYREGSVQPVQENYKPGKAKDHIKINRRYEQKLGDVTEEQAIAEGFNNLEEFKAEWCAITKKPWNPEQIVTAYEFELIKRDSRTDKP